MNKAKHIRVFETLRAQILAGEYAPDRKFPSEQMLVRRFGVSRPTITRALLDLKAAGLIEGRSGSGTYLGPVAKTAAGFLGMIVPDRDWNMFFAAVANGIEANARTAGYTLLKDDCTAKSPDERAYQMERLAREFALKRVRGVIVAPFESWEKSDLATRRILDELRKSDTPVVLIDRDYAPEAGRSAYDLVAADNFRAGYLLARHFVRQGARRPAFLRLPRSGTATLDRIAGFARGLQDGGLRKSGVRELEFDATDLQAVRKLFAAKDRPDAIACHNDHVAAYLLQTLAKLKIRIPHDVMIGSFDDCNLAEMLSPPLTSVRQPAADIAETAFRMLLDRIASPSAAPRKILLDVSLSVRATTAREESVRSPREDKRPHKSRRPG